MATISSGSCLCGKCTYSYTDKPVMKAICHCPPCKKISGGTNTLNFAVLDQNFTLTKGNPTSFSIDHEYGMIVTVSFCPGCGNTLWKEATGEGMKGMKLIQAGTLQDTSKLNDNIDAEFYVERRVSWLAPLPDVAQKKEF
ncbi:uncharacterized protein N7484_001617 [Penicillium longicatenatum]|uniref:uncharacterized protein n=1 Tax=Penicillium longicatenatum TaxID=1561947 RepID=UPI00254895DD|nr:uncharacterized protein N7484_001617 [Penicillium longicatenatum]KAJ5657968.1 hypothetical protein N7484_001617 [Penicillium longicatenatum]